MENRTDPAESFCHKSNAFSLVFSEERFIVVDKAPGVDFHGKGGLVDAVRTQLEIQDLFTVHRLDRITSGLVLFARGREYARELSGLFRQRDVEKYYLSLSDRMPRKKRGIITGDMVKSRRGAYRLTRSRKNPAVTRYVCLGRTGRLVMFIVRPLTGRTHQVRVALKSIGAPVLGDPIYYRRSLSEKGTDRAYLHAFAMRFSIDGGEFSFVRIPGSGIHFGEEAIREKMEGVTAPWELAWDHSHLNSKL
jgi:tRNA pseudouridine32 synthase/23S rRNA pseudouridine746 synthase